MRLKRSDDKKRFQTPDGVRKTLFVCKKIAGGYPFIKATGRITVNTVPCPGADCTEMEP